jgi:hypothetical protein
VGEVQGVIEGCRRQMGRVDEVFNSWGVRRMAAPAIGSDGTFYGIVALAETSLHRVLPVSGRNPQQEVHIFTLQPWFLCNSMATTLLVPA